MSELFKFTLADAIGFAGAAAILFAFGANLTAKWRTTDVIYKLFNFGGATLVAYSLLCRPNLAALTVEILWAVISLIALMRPDRFEEESEPEERFLMSPLHWYGRWPLSLWHQSRERQRAIRQRRRAWRLLDAAANSVGALAQGVAAPPGAPVSAQTIAREISGIRHTLDGDALSCLSGNSRETLEGLFQDVQTRVAAAPPEWTEWLAGLQRALEAQRRTLDPWAPRRPEMPAQPDRTGDAVSGRQKDEAKEEDAQKKLTSDEAAVLASLTEKFYGSWSFKIIGGALVAAAFLAGAGTLFLGAHTVSLRDDLDKAKKQGEDELKNSTNTLQVSIDKQMDALKIANTGIQDKTRDFEKRLEDGKERIARVISNFTEKSDEIKKQIADIVVQRLDGELRNKLSDISVQITQRGNAALSEIDVAKSNELAPLSTRGREIKTKLDELAETTTNADNELRKQAPVLDRLKGLAAKLDEVGDKLNRIEAKEATLDASVNKAGTQAGLAASHAEAATQAAAAAERARASANTAVTTAAEDAPKLIRRLGGVEAQLEDMDTRLKALRTKIDQRDAVVPPAANPPDIGPLTRRVDQLEQRVDQIRPVQSPVDIAPLTTRLANLEERLRHIPNPPDLGPLTKRVDIIEEKLRPVPPASPRLPASEGQLTIPPKMMIQWALAYRGFNPGEIDGNLGRIGSSARTRAAIEQYRKASGSRARGELTAAEIADLLSPPQ